MQEQTNPLDQNQPPPPSEPAATDAFTNSSELVNEPQAPAQGGQDTTGQVPEKVSTPEPVPEPEAMTIPEVPPPERPLHSNLLKSLWLNFWSCGPPR